MKLDAFARSLVFEHRRKVVAVSLAVLFVLSLGLPGVVLDTTLEEFRGGTEEHAADTYVERHLSGQAPNSTAAFVVVRDDENVLTRERYLQQLRAQQRIREDEVVGPTLVEDQQPLGVANVVAVVAMERQRNGTAAENITVEPRPPLEEQIAAIEGLSEFEINLYTSYAVGIVMNDVEHTWPEGGSFATVPTSYHWNAKASTSTAIVVSHRDDTEAEELARAQTRMADIVEEEVDGEAMVIGNGVVDDELRRSSFDSLGIVGPLAFLFMLVVLPRPLRRRPRTARRPVRPPLDVRLHGLGRHHVQPAVRRGPGAADGAVHRLRDPRVHAVSGGSTTGRPSRF